MIMKTVLSLAAVAVLASCASPAPTHEETMQVVKSSFKASTSVVTRVTSLPTGFRSRKAG